MKQAQAARRLADSARKMSRVLAVTNDRVFEAACEKLLGGHGHSVMCMRTPEGAMMLVRAGACDVLMVDADLADGSAHRLAAEAATHVPTLLATSREFDAAPWGVEVVAKPVADDLGDAVDRLTAGLEHR